MGNNKSTVSDWITTEQRRLLMLFVQDLQQQNFSPRSINSYISNLNSYFHFLVALEKDRPQDVDLELLEAYQLSQIEKGFSSHTVEKRIRVVQNFYNFLEKQGEIFYSIANNMGKYRAEKKLPYIPTEAEVEQLIESLQTHTPAGIRNRTVVEFAYSTAVRQNELARIDLDDIRLDEGTVRIWGKGSKERIVPIGMTAMDWLKKYLAVRDELKPAPEERGLWINNKSERVTDHKLQKDFKERHKWVELRKPLTFYPKPLGFLPECYLYYWSS